MRPLIITVSCLMVLLNANLAVADRRTLSPPATYVYNAAKYLDGRYLNSINELSALLKNSGDSKALELANSLRKTNQKKDSLLIVEELERKFQRSSLSSANTLIKKIKVMISDGSYNNHTTGVGLIVDDVHKEYIFSWDEDGEQTVKRVPMVPRMNVIIKASYIPSKSNTKKFVYQIDSHISSKSSFFSLHLENKFSQSEINAYVKQIGGEVSRVTKSNSIKQNLSFPGGKVNRFEIYNYNYIIDKLIKYKPGAKMDFPFELEALDNSLPGLVETSIDIHFTDYNPSSIISSESPEIAVEIIRGFLSRPHANRYWGRTIGPVPIPNPFDRVQFIDKIINYLNISTEEGWIENKEVIEYLKSALQKVKSNPGNKVQIKELIDSIEEYNKKEMMLSEAYSLLKYNLEYLLRAQ